MPARFTAPARLSNLNILTYTEETYKVVGKTLVRAIQLPVESYG